MYKNNQPKLKIKKHHQIIQGGMRLVITDDFVQTKWVAVWFSCCRRTWVWSKRVWEGVCCGGVVCF